MLALLLFLGFAGTIEFQPIKTLELPPEEDDLYLQSVLYIEVDDQGRYYASDYPSARIHMWNPDGSYKGNFGRKGEGPGEFDFGAELGPPLGYIKVLEGRIYVYDGRKRTVSVLNLEDHAFIKKITFDGLGGKINNFQVLGVDRFLFYDSYFCEKKACRRILEYNGDGKLTKTWKEDPDNTWAMDEANRRVNLYIWEPIPVVDYHPDFKEVVYSFSNQPILEVFDNKGTLKRTLRLDIPKKSVTRDDREEFDSQEWVKGNNGVKIIYPDEKDYFDQILTLEDGYLVYHMSARFGIADGFMVDRAGKLKGRFRLDCGEGGGLFAPRGQLMAALIDDEGEFKLQALTLKGAALTDN